MPPTVAPLVPRAKTQKRKRPAFRPVTKSPKSAVSKPKARKNAAVVEEKLLSDGKLHANVLHPATEDRKLTHATTPSGSQQPYQSKPETPFKNDNAGSSPRRSRKRKQSTGLVSIGSSRKPPPVEGRKEATPTDTSAVSLPAAAVAPPAAAAIETRADQETSENASAATDIPALTQLPLVEPVDRDQLTLQRLAEEDPEGSRLTSFCSKFKRRRHPQRKKKKDNNNAGNAASAAVNAAEAAGGNNEGNEGGLNQAQKSVARSEPTGTPVVQIVNGEIVLQESSLMVPGARRSVQEVEEEFQNVVEEDAQAAIVGASYNSFVNRKGPQHWTLKETKRFYEALRQLGTDFCSMEAFFENRSRKQLKKKFQSESAKNPALIEKALNPKFRAEIDLSVFNVTVDPTAIEAAENETLNPEDTADLAEPLTQKTTASAGDNLNAESGGQKDSDETVVAEKQSQVATASSAKELVSVWPNKEVRQDSQDVVDQTLDDAFYMHHDNNEADDDAAGSTTGGSINVEAGTNGEPTFRPAVQKTSEPAAISLVPTKTKQKTKRVKFRSAAARKRKSG